MQVIICEEVEKCLVNCMGEFNGKRYSVQVEKLSMKSLQELFDESKLAEGSVIILGVYTETMAQKCVQMMKILRANRADIRFIVCIAALRCLDAMFEIEPDYIFSLPVNGKNLRKAVDNCYDGYVNQSRFYVKVQRKGRFDCIDSSEIVCIESRGRCLEIALQQGEMVTVYMQLNEMQGKLPQFFLRCHQSYCINLHQVKGYDCGKILMNNQKEIPVSKRYRHEVIEILKKYVKK